MVSTQPNISDTARFTAFEAARLLGVHRNTLNNHTKAGHIRCGVCRNTQRKYYFGCEIKRFWRNYVL